MGVKRICLMCHMEVDEEEEICPNCGNDDIVRESDLIYGEGDYV